MSNVQNFYDQNVESEWERLGVRHRTEFAVTLRALKEFLPPAPAKIIDIGGGPGRYAIALTQLGYSVTLVDLSKSNLALALQKTAEAGGVLESIVHANALDLSVIPSECFDGALLMGPLYHLQTVDERLCALREARRLLKPDGVFFAAFISRFAPFRDAATKGSSWVLENPRTMERILQTGINNQEEDGFTDAFFAHPDEIVPLCESMGFETICIMGCEGVVAGHEDQINQLEGADFERWADLNYRLGKDHALIGAADHILYIGRKNV